MKYAQFIRTKSHTTIHIDLVDPLVISNGYSYILAIVDRFTRWLEAYPISDITAITISDTFVEQYTSTRNNNRPR